MPNRHGELGLAQAAVLFAALGDPTRLALVRQLSDTGPASISSLAENFRVSRQAVTKHLKLLATAGIVDGEHVGREHVWTLNPARLADAEQCLKLIARGWDAALGRLKAHLEQE